MNNKRIGQMIFSTGNKLRRVLNKKLLKFGVSGVQSRTLNFIYRHSKYHDVYQKDIECYLSIRSSTATELVKGLIASGFVESTVSEEDKRKKRLELTKKGKEVANQTIKILTDIENEFIKTISKKKYDEFIHLVTTLEEILEDKETELDD